MSTETTSNRKLDHLDLAFLSQVSDTDNRFYYEPVLRAHPLHELTQKNFLGKTLNTPIWVSSMTGGASHAKTINENLAKACGKYGMGMGLGSCRIILDNDDYLSDFKVRKWIGDDRPLYANLGIAQIEDLVFKGGIGKIKTLIDRTEADGLIVHINPLQEWLQPEGDFIGRSPLETLSELIDKTDLKIIAKEVGQGMGPKSLHALMQLPLAAIDFGAHGGTNFSMLEMSRGDALSKEAFEPVPRLGHKAEEMVDFVNGFLSKNQNFACSEFIISGGVQNFLDGYYLTHKLDANSIYGQASVFLKYAKDSAELLFDYVETQIKGLQMAEAFLTLK